MSSPSSILYIKHRCGCAIKAFKLLYNNYSTNYLENQLFFNRQSSYQIASLH